jgi:endonuclease YncB( thermonuclease family)
MRDMRSWAIIAVFALFAASANASPLSELDLTREDSVAVSTVRDAETVELADGRVLRLAAIETAHALPPRTGANERPDGRLAPLAEAARRKLGELTINKTVTLYRERQRDDRYGRVIAQAETEDGLWLQGELVGRGLARVHTTADTAAAAIPLLNLEAAARDRRLGLWALPQFQVRAATDTARLLDSFQIIEGRITSARSTRSQIWLDFEGEKGKALAVTTAAGSRARLRASGLDLASLSGATVRVRGWIQWRNGPVIEIDHAAQVEVLSRKR